MQIGLGRGFKAAAGAVQAQQVHLPERGRGAQHPGEHGPADQAQAQQACCFEAREKEAVKRTTLAARKGPLALMPAAGLLKPGSLLPARMATPRFRPLPAKRGRSEFLISGQQFVCMSSCCQD